MKKLFLMFTAGAVFALSASLALGQDAEVMEKVVVTAGRIAEKAQTVTQATTVIPREEIEKNQYTDLGSMLRNYGIQVNSYTPNQGLSQVAIRGVRSSAMGSDLQGAVLVLVDGRRIGTDNLSMLPMVNVERIEIIRGPASVQYGSSAIGGVINVITKRGIGALQPEGKNLAARLEAGGGSFDTYKTQAELAAEKHGVDFSGGVSWLTGDDYKTGSGRTYHNTDIDYKLGYSMNLGYNFNEENRLGALLMGTRNEKAGSSNELRQNDRTAYSDRNNYSADLVYDGGYKNLGLNWKGRYFNGQDDYLFDEPDGLYGPSHYNSENNYQGAQGQLSWNKSFITLTGGVDYLYYDIDVHSSDQTHKYSNTGTFLLSKFSFLDDLLILSGGLRYDDYDLKYQSHKGSLNHTSPSVGLAVNPAKWLTLRGNYGESYRVPQAQEITGFTSYGITYLGNSGLKPEEGKSWDGGFEINHKGLNLGLTYFQTDYENKIATRSAGGYDREYYNLDGKSKFRGLEAQAGYDVGALLDWPFMLRPYLNMTTLFKYDDEDGNTLENVSRHDIAYGLNFNHPDWGLDADLRFTYYGKQAQTDFGTPPSYLSREINVGPSTVVDLFVTKTIHNWEDIGTLSVKGEVRNMFDEDYETIYAYPMPGRSFYVGLQYEY